METGQSFWNAGISFEKLTQTLGGLHYSHKNKNSYGFTVVTFIVEKTMRIQFFPIVSSILIMSGCVGEEAAKSTKAMNAPAKNPAADFEAAVQKLKGHTFQDSEGAMIWVQFPTTAPTDSDLKELLPAIAASPSRVGLMLIDSKKITDAGLALMKDQPKLVGLLAIDITADRLKTICEITSLEKLTFSSNEIIDSDLAPLAKLTKLRELSFEGDILTEECFAHLSGLTQIEKIPSIANAKFGDIALEHMKGMTKLKELRLCDHGLPGKLSDAGFAHIKNFTQLRKLSFHGEKLTPVGLKSLSGLTELESLTIVKCPEINGIGMAPLKELRNLKELDIINCGKLTSEATVHLAGLTNLKKIHFDAIEDEALKGIKDFKGLENLNLYATSVGDAGMAYLKDLKGLRSLDLTKALVTDNGLKHLAGLNFLQDLNLCCNEGITGSGLKDLNGLNLQALYLSKCKIADAGLLGMDHLASLKKLDLIGNPITDVGTGHLKNFKALESLNLLGSQVSDGCAEDLKKSLPKTQIFGSSGTEITLNQKHPQAPVKGVTEDLTKIAPAFSLNAKEFFKEYSNDGKGREKYRGQVIELTGEAQDFVHNANGHGVTLSTDNKFEFVTCNTAENEPWGRVSVGSKIKVKGRCSQRSNGPELVSCILIETGDYQPIVLTADELGKEYAEPVDADKKYNEKRLIITGEIASIDFLSGGAANIVLKSEGNVKMLCWVSSFDNETVKKLKVGQKIKLCGKYAKNPNNDEIFLHFCVLFKKP